MENQFTQDTPLTELEQMRMKVILTSCTHPEYGEVTIPFPIPDEEYDHTMDLLGGLNIGIHWRRTARLSVWRASIPS